MEKGSFSSEDDGAVTFARSERWSLSSHEEEFD